MQCCLWYSTLHYEEFLKHSKIVWHSPDFGPSSVAIFLQNVEKRRKATLITHYTFCAALHRKMFIRLDYLKLRLWQDVAVETPRTFITED